MSLGFNSLRKSLMLLPWCEYIVPVNGVNR
jgi:hypothetical protein